LSASLATHGWYVVRGLLDPDERLALQRRCDDVLDRVRADWSETGHSTPRIRLDVPEVYSLFARPRVVTLLPRDIVRLEAVHYYHEQTKKDWNGDWHRDDGDREVHVRVALVAEDCLAIVPGSHLRADTGEELHIRKGADRASDAMPNATRIVLDAGDACIFDACTIHRATYRREPVRRTIDAVFVRRATPRDLRR
jgi:hypothetical protein